MTTPSTGSIESRIAEQLGVRERQVRAAVELLDGGATVPFIARYRKEATEMLDDAQLRTLEERLRYLRELEERRTAVLESVAEQGKLTDELRAAIEAAETKARLEDIYLPFKPKRRTKAQIAKEAGLEPLADGLLGDPSAEPLSAAAAFADPEKGVADAQAALDGARAILAERFSEDADLIGTLRERMWGRGRLAAKVREGQEEAGAKFSDYFDFAEPFTELPSHRVLAMLRGEKEGVLDLNLEPEEPQADPSAPSSYEVEVASRFGIADRGRPGDKWLLDTARWAWRTRIMVHLGIDVRSRLRTAAEDEAVRVFAANLRDLLLAAPAGTRATLGLDPGFRTGVKVAVVDATGKVVATDTIYPHVPRNQWDGSLEKLAALARAHQVELVAIGNGTASRETDKLAGDLIAAHPELKLTKVMVSEAGASVYSASEFASQELPELDVSLRGAVSIARRLQDPLAELVKIDPKSIGVGQYQHDLSEVKLSRSLDAVVEDCVNGVGVDVNTASAPLLARVSGIGSGLAENIVAHRDSNGPFTSRKALKDVSRLGPKAYEQCAGFLRIRGGDDPLDASAVHPEAYPVVRRMAKAAGGVDVLIGSAATLRSLNAREFVDEKFGLPTVTDILRELEKPGRDPRPAFRTATFREGVEKLSDLEAGMVLEGVVTNVAAFGAFVDVGVHQDGLVHVSAMSRNFVKDPREVVKPGDIVKVKVMEVDAARKRISLTLRLDDEPGAAGGGRERRGGGEGRSGGGRPAQSRGAGGRQGERRGGARAPQQRQGRGGGGGQSAPPPANDAMADALRRAGLVDPKRR
ncbi:RNA-binding transcriptional accessory protein [Streptomyces sp. CHA1]|uniref:Tex family protein n=3 Tax=Streptomyces TaxID=1883 RepID=UPI001BFC7B6B|nr:MULTISPECIES: Tex family protein [unclassified Streptomyces]WDV30671.1 RNA-binding transcriptional accessory protein [Streptomyces sp. AD16]WSB23656.1 RNA-binding transcriptional accessory protein [Streptomyces albidoflavus]MBT3159138.1 RNA-binding transcriptional accessory protein [Streptomyces sp. G11C]MCO6729404.1 RNA-binding transcriptional accessory protein [Streptomyces sp. EL9]MCO6741176.1 RNA-binding transcriptional accessory protein [Streptomyces sp. CHA1]